MKPTNYTLIDDSLIDDINDVNDPRAATRVLLHRRNNRANNVIIVDSATDVIGHLVDADELVVGDSWEILQVGEGSLTVNTKTVALGQSVALISSLGGGFTTQQGETLVIRCHERKGRGTHASVVLKVIGGVSSGALELTVRTAADGETFTVPVRAGYEYATIVDWGDGVIEEIGGLENPLWTHTYATAGDHPISITGTFGALYFNNTGDKDKLISVDQWGGVGANMVAIDYAFNGCTNLVSLPVDMDLVGFVNGTLAFGGCTSLTALPDGLTLSTVTNGDSMFYNCPALAALPDGVTLAKLEIGQSMFSGCTALTTIPAEVTLSKLSAGHDMFLGVTLATPDYSALLVRMNDGNPNTGVTFHGGLSQYDDTGAVAHDALLARDPAWVITDGGLKVPVPIKITVRTTADAEAFVPLVRADKVHDATVDWGDGIVEEGFISATDPRWTHTYATAGDHQITISGVFGGFHFGAGAGTPASLISIDQWGTVGEAVTSMDVAFIRCSNLVSLPDDMVLVNVTSATSAFDGCTKLVSLGNGIRLPKLTNGYSLFYGCSELASLPPSLTLDSMTSGSEMFKRCQRLAALPVELELTKLEIGSRMFNECYALTSAPGLTLNALTDGNEMFFGCTINTPDYSALLVRMNDGNPNTGVTFHGGLSQYDATGEVARNALLARVPAWTILDGGLAP